MKKIPIGVDDFKKLIEDNYYFIDKSMFIKEFWDETDVILITRPRRFGKTLNMSMLKYFFDMNEDSSHLFQGLNIESDKEMMELHGKFPVIYLSFRGCSGLNIETTLNSVITEVKREFLRHEYIKNNLSDSYQKVFDAFINYDNKGWYLNFATSISMLSELIYLSSGIKPIILVDEYDNPINNDYVKGFYEEIIGFLRPFYENTLKNNIFMERAVITGVLRVAKESIFSGLNNLSVSTIFNEEFNDKFGFVESEVEELFKYYNIDFDLGYVKDYYNGYIFGGVNIFNPWSIINYVKAFNKNYYKNKAFWVNTSSNDIIKNLMETNPDSYKKDLEKLIKGEAIVKVVDENVAYKYLAKKSDAPWSLMLFSGYLKVVEFLDRKRVSLKIPNKEIRNIYQDVVVEWVSKSYDISEYNSIIDYLLYGELEEFSEGFKDLIFSSMSFFDPSGQKPENFYHGFVLGLLALLIDTYEIKYNIKSNREAGKGRADIMIIPKDTSKLGIILEFKKADTETDLKIEANDALNQIYEKKYPEELKSLGINEIKNIGISFYGKECEIVWN